jgi:nitroreductase
MNVDMTDSSVPTNLAEAAAELMQRRRSTRAFLSKPVNRDTLHAILDSARHAPSGTNIQPWNVYVATGSTQDVLVAKLCAAFDDPEATEKYRDEYPYYPEKWMSPYVERRRKVGWDLYSLLGIKKDDKARMFAQHRRNVECFGAPASMFFTVDRRLAMGSWLDYGMFIQNVALAVTAHGLASCVQAAFNPYHSVIRDVLGWPEGEMLVCGMSVGYADPSAIENTLVVEREPVDFFTKFFD